jgi:uncharacterized protein with gpF-like domain
MAGVRQKRDKTVKFLPPVRPNVGLEMSYRKKLINAVEEMDRSIRYWIRAAYRDNPPAMARDEAPADTLRRALRDLSKRWLSRFDEMANEIGEWFAQAVAERSDRALLAALKRGGFAIELNMTPAARDIIKATIAQQVGLIRSIPRQHLVDVEGLVMRSVQTGRDLGQLTKDLQKSFGVTKRRAMLIARHQNNIATASITRARQTELGILQARWVHSGGGKHPRPTHLKAGRERVVYDVAEGWYDPAIKRNIWPGTEINCRCVAAAVVPGLR